MTDERNPEDLTFLEGDFQFKGAHDTKLDMNFASQSFWKDAYGRFLRNKGAMVS